MPGPEPTYGSPAKKQKAYRDRNREQLRERLRNQRQQTAALKIAAVELHEAVQQAAAAGDDQAGELGGTDPKETIQNLTQFFKERAGTPQAS